MKEINISKVLSSKRKEKGITQDELAEYIGVSKASVSKWETGQSYPDVTFLPQLAAYFNISIDELMDYKPQMTKEDIHKLYKRYCSEFTVKPFDSVLDECRLIIKKYYSCFPLLHQMGLLIFNHLELVNDPEKAQSLLSEAKSLFVRVRQESEDVSLTKQALFMDALCYLAEGDPNSTLELLEGTIAPAMPPESLISSAYQMLGRKDEAKSVLQVGIYQNIVVLFNYFPAYLMLCADDQNKFEEVLKRALLISDVFDMRHLHPGVLVSLYLSSAQGYVIQGNNEKALHMLMQYTDIVTGDIYPLRLHGDSYFDLLEGWLNKLDLGTDLPRDEKTVRKSMVSVVADNPAFSVLNGEQRYLSLVERLKRNL